MHAGNSAVVWHPAPWLRHPRVRSVLLEFASAQSYDGLVHFFFDESGDYGFPEERFDCYVQAALVCPDSVLPAIAAFVDQRKAAWGVEELHATKLDLDQLLEVARFIESSDCQLLAHVTDTVLVTKNGIAEFRLGQAARLKRNLDWYRRESTKARGAPVAEIEEWYLRHIKRAGLASQISHGEFVQALYLVELVIDAVQKALLLYHEERWRDDFEDFYFVLDAKLPTKMASGEKYLNDSLVPALGSRPGEGLVLVDTWQENPVHPFVQKFAGKEGRIRGHDVESAIDLSLMFEHGLDFADSKKEAGLQLVDAAAYIVRRAVLEPDEDRVQTVYDALRSKLRNDKGKSLTIHRLGVSEEDRSSLERYRPLYGPARPAGS